jgi:hypothetical protein
MVGLLVKSDIPHSYNRIQEKRLQLLLCTPVALLAGAAYIGISTPSRRVAVNIFSIMRELKNARTLTAA